MGIRCSKASTLAVKEVLVASLDKASGAAIKKRPKIVGPGVVVRVVVEMDQANKPAATVEPPARRTTLVGASRGTA
jgi:elongation factor 1 alpha-like protein